MKRLFDVVMCAVAILILAPVLIVLAMVIWLKMGRPIVFSQERPGYKGRPFRMYKLRTMVDAKDEQGNLLPDQDRLTPLGRFLRSTSLDELPELWNVLKGDMSLVGPRPLLMEYLPLYSPEQARRNEVLPGITGWAQINGRNSLSWEERFKHDVWYVDHQSLGLDLKILWITLFKVVQRHGISQDGEATMSKFTGSKG